MDDDFEIPDMFDEPEGFRPARPEAHFADYKRIDGKTPQDIKLRLVGSSPLWGHLLWNAGIFTANYLDEHSGDLVEGKKVLELGAAASLPSIICGLNGATKVVSTDYPDVELIENIKYNFEHTEGIPTSTEVIVKGYIWGNDVRTLLFNTEEEKLPDFLEIKEEDKFDLVILSDLVFNHTEHGRLLETCRQSLKKTGKALVVFSPHRAHLLENDLQFFTTCEEYQLKAEKIDLVTWKPMFEEDEETSEIRARVYSFFLHPQW